jgi:RNA polymerase sigma-70 factor (ECF subfamily)
LKEIIYQDILANCKKGDPNAQYKLFKLYAKQMFNVAFRICGNTFEAEDAVQEAFIKAFKKIGSFKGNSTFGAWLKRIVVNQCISEIRKQKHFFTSIDDVEKTHLMIEDEVEDAISIEKVRSAIENLPEGARVVFTLKAIEEYKFAEISEMLNLSISNCKVQYHRSKKLLNEKLKGMLENSY